MPLGELAIGGSLRSVALVAIRTGDSFIALASFASELPVQGAISMTSSSLDGPSGSASGIDLIAFSPVMCSIFATHSSASAKRVLVDCTVYDRIGTTRAPIRTSSSIAG